jgi:hypothetical protein
VAVTAAVDEALFYWPAVLDKRTAATTVIDVEAGVERLTRYLQHDSFYPTKEDEHLPLVPPVSDRVGRGSVSFCSALAEYLLGHLAAAGWSIMENPFDCRRLRKRYDDIRMQAEYDWLWARCWRWARSSESSMAKLLCHNTSEAWVTANAVDMTPLDEQWFLSNFATAAGGGTASYVPTVCLVIPLEDAPWSNMPKYVGGRVHLPLYWEVMVPWIHQSYVVDEQRAWSSSGGNGAWDEQVLRGLKCAAVQFCRHVMQPRHHHHTGGDVKKARRDNGAASAAPAVYDVDIEDTWAVLPPCLSALREKQRFPRNQERLRLVPAMIQGGISVESTTAFLKALNERYPKEDGAESLERRAGLSSLIKLAAKDDSVHWCANVIRNTSAGEVTIIQCPFAAAAGAAATAASFDQIKSSCGAQCAQKLGLRYAPNAPKNAISQLLKRRYKQ